MSKSTHAIEMAKKYFEQFPAFWTEFSKLPEPFQFLVLNNAANFAVEMAKTQRGLCQQEIWSSKAAIIQTDSWVVSPKQLDVIMLNAPDPVEIDMIISR